MTAEGTTEVWGARETKEIAFVFTKARVVRARLKHLSIKEAPEPPRITRNAVVKGVFIFDGSFDVHYVLVCLGDRFSGRRNDLLIANIRDRVFTHAQHRSGIATRPAVAITRYWNVGHNMMTNVRVRRCKKSITLTGVI